MRNIQARLSRKSLYLVFHSSFSILHLSATKILSHFPNFQLDLIKWHRIALANTCFSHLSKSKLMNFSLRRFFFWTWLDSSILLTGWTFVYSILPCAPLIGPVRRAEVRWLIFDLSCLFVCFCLGITLGERYQRLFSFFVCKGKRLSIFRLPQPFSYPEHSSTVDVRPSSKRDQLRATGLIFDLSFPLFYSSIPSFSPFPS